MSQPAVFLDRDGTLIEERGYLDRLEMLVVFPWTADALRLLNRAGFATVVITNQSAIGARAHRRSVSRRVIGRSTRGWRRAARVIDRYYFCPHYPDAKLERYRQHCGCRKPAPGMIEQACREMDLDPARSVMVGDRWLDVACGRAAGVRGVLVRTGHGADEAR